MSGAAATFVWLGYIAASVITGVLVWRSQRNLEGNDIEEDIGNDPMNLTFDKRFKKSKECLCLRTVVQVIYDYTRKGIFNFFSLIFGIIMSILWGFTMGQTEFTLVWYVLPSLDFGKRFYLPLAQIVGDLLNAIFGQCFKNLKTQPASFNFVNLNGNNNIIYKKENIDNDNEVMEAFSEKDFFGLNFITTFPKSDEIKGIRNVEKICYNVCRIGSYNVLVAIIGIPLSLIWGILYGIFQFIYIWLYSPYLRIYQIFAVPLARVSGLIINAIYGKCLRNLRSEPYSFNFGNNNDNLIENNNNVNLNVNVETVGTDGQLTTSNNNTQIKQQSGYQKPPLQSQIQAQMQPQNVNVPKDGNQIGTAPAVNYQ